MHSLSARATAIVSALQVIILAVTATAGRRRAPIAVDTGMTLLLVAEFAQGGPASRLSADHTVTTTLPTCCPRSR
jgi:hypothetical protein